MRRWRGVEAARPGIFLFSFFFRFMFQNEIRLSYFSLVICYLKICCSSLVRVSDIITERLEILMTSLRFFVRSIFFFHHSPIPSVRMLMESSSTTAVSSSFFFFLPPFPAEAAVEFFLAFLLLSLIISSSICLANNFGTSP